MASVDQAQKTGDSRFLRHKVFAGEFEFYSMHRRNIRVEGDGLAYHDINIVRAVLLEPILYVLMVSNMLISYIDRSPLARGGRVGYVVALVFSHILGFTFNILRYALSIIVFLTEFILWPLRVCCGTILAPIAMLLCAGHIYGLPCHILHIFLRGAGPVVIRKVRVQLIHQCPRILNAGGLGKVCCYETDSIEDASYIASTFKIKQRCGTGPECIWIRGRRVFVSSWYQISLTSLFASGRMEWKLLDLTTLTWRFTHFEFQHRDKTSDNQPPKRDEDVAEISPGCKKDQTCNTVRRREKVQDEVGKWAFPQSFEELDVVSKLSDTELYYNSLLGWNKHHLMSAEGHKIRVIRNDRRALSHLMALVSSLVLYIQFRDSSQGWLGVSIELYALIIANYALITSYAGEILVGKATEVVDAKSNRYGVIVTRAIDRGYVRGFHVPNGDWLRYENGDPSLPMHEIKRSEVNVTCNSYVYEGEHGPMIKVVSYCSHPPPFHLPWGPAEAA